MATALPPLAKISMIGIWVETLLYGVNCVMYGLCMSVIFRTWKTAPLRWVLAVISTLLFLLCTTHVGASLRQLLEAFVYAPADVPNYSTTYWLHYTTTLYFLKGNIYTTLVGDLGADIVNSAMLTEVTKMLILDVILIWRLYAVFMFNWRVIILPIVLATGCVGSAYAASAVFVFPSHGFYDQPSTLLIISAWVCGFTLNTFVSGAIVTRLWRIGRTVASLTATSSNRFAPSVYLVVESGAISAVVNATTLALFALESPAALPGMDVASQLIAMTPLLIIAQLGQTDRGRYLMDDALKRSSTSHYEITFRAGIPRDLAEDAV